MTFKKLFKKVAAVLVAGATVIAMAVPALAAGNVITDDGSDGIFKIVMAEEGKPTASGEYKYNLGTIIDGMGVDLASISKVEAFFELESTNPDDVFFQIKMGGNAAAGWSDNGQSNGSNDISTTGSYSQSWEPANGLSDNYVEIQVGWCKPGTIKCTKVVVTTSDGVAHTYPAAAPQDSTTAAPQDSTTAASAGSNTGDSANIGLILAIVAAVVVVGATVVLKKRETVER